MLRMSPEGGNPLRLRFATPYPRASLSPSLPPAYGWCQMGGPGGRPQRGRLPPELHSEITFMAEGPLEGPGGPGGWGPTLWGHPAECWPLPLGDRVSGLTGGLWPREALRECPAEGWPGIRGALKAPLFI